VSKNGKNKFLPIFNGQPNPNIFFKIQKKNFFFFSKLDFFHLPLLLVTEICHFWRGAAIIFHF